VWGGMRQHLGHLPMLLKQMLRLLLYLLLRLLLLTMLLKQMLLHNMLLLCHHLRPSQANTSMPLLRASTNIQGSTCIHA
jgi:hypothetical protein